MMIIMMVNYLINMIYMMMMMMMLLVMMMMMMMMMMMIWYDYDMSMILIIITAINCNGILLNYCSLICQHNVHPKTYCEYINKMWSYLYVLCRNVSKYGKSRQSVHINKLTFLPHIKVTGF